ncbi:MAG: ArsR family transcriptional regulator [Promethearchaeota archaeon]|nr:MAG: ArsR family transcriptional regulator [Candidatus Lokiarchaeota archaeon]
MEDKNLEDKNEDSVKEEVFYYALGHNLRREIIKIIGENDYSSFTQLKKILKVSTGTIYHHLDTLSNLIEQKEDKKYYLTEIGQYAYESLIDSEKNIGSPVIFQFKNKYLARFFNFYSEFIQASEKKDIIKIIIISSIILFLGIIFNGLNGYNSFLLFFTPSLYIDFFIFNGLTFLINVFIFFVIVEAFCRIFYRNKANFKLLLISFPLILAPMVIYLGIHFMFQITNVLMNYIFYLMDRIIIISLQVLSLWFLSYHLNVMKNLKINQGLTISLILHLAGFSVIFFSSVQF